MSSPCCPAPAARRTGVPRECVLSGGELHRPVRRPLPPAPPRGRTAHACGIFQVTHHGVLADTVHNAGCKEGGEDPCGRDRRWPAQQGGCRRLEEAAGSTNGPCSPAGSGASCGEEPRSWRPDPVHPAAWYGAAIRSLHLAAVALPLAAPEGADEAEAAAARRQGGGGASGGVRRADVSVYPLRRSWWWQPRLPSPPTPRLHPEPSGGHRFLHQQLEGAERVHGLA